MTALTRKLSISVPETKIRTVLAVFLFLLGTVYSFQLSGRLPQHLLDGARRPADVWFEADIVFYSANMTARDSDHHRTARHPLFSLVAFPPTAALRFLGVPDLTAVRLVVAVAAGIWCGAMFIALGGIGLRPADAAIFTLLAASTASFMFMAPIPETYLLGSLSIVGVLVMMGIARRQPVSRLWQTIVNAGSLSMTVTNWMVGILAALALNDRKGCYRICRDAFLMVTLLWGVEKILFPTAEYFLVARDRAQHFFLGEAGGLVDKLTSFFVHAIVMPPVEVLQNPYIKVLPMLGVQHASLGGHGTLGMVAVVLWSVLLAFGAVAAWRADAARKVFLVVGAAIAGQFLLHFVYGQESFLYSLHWLPLLIAVAAAGALSSQRIVVVAVAAALTVAAGVNNFEHFTGAATLVGHAFAKTGL